MINAMGEVLKKKTLAEYKVIEDRYLTLKRYLFVLERVLLLDFNQSLRRTRATPPFTKEARI